MQPNISPLIIRKIIILIVFIGFILTAVYWLFTHGFVEVTASGSGDTTYSLVHQGTQKSTEFQSADGKIKKLVRRGSYEVVARQGDRSGFTLTRAGGFLSTTRATTDIKPEKHRQFIGNNPSPCMYLAGQVLLSYGCNEPYKNTQVHVPATETTPTHTRRVPEILEGRTEGIVTTAQGTFVILKAPTVNEDQGDPHTAFRLQPDYTLTGGVTLQGLDRKKIYTIEPYKEGFVAYDSTKQDIFYFGSVNAPPTMVATEKPKDTKFKPYSVAVSKQAIAVAYTDSVEDGTVEIHDTEGGKAKTELVINREGTAPTHFIFKQLYGAVRLCGTDKLCLLGSGKRLEVFDISGKKQALLFTLTGVDRLDDIDGNPIVVRANETLSLDVDKQTGNVQYSLGDYQSCGMQKQSSGYVLCLITNRNSKVALYINPAADNNGSIDKKIAELLKLPEIKDISIYDRFITVSPELGKPVYNPAVQGFTYDPNTRNTVNTKINQEVARLGIDLNVYRVRNPFD